MITIINGARVSITSDYTFPRWTYHDNCYLIIVYTCVYTLEYVHQFFLIKKICSFYRIKRITFYIIFYGLFRKLLFFYAIEKYLKNNVRIRKKSTEYLMYCNSFKFLRNKQFVKITK